MGFRIFSTLICLAFAIIAVQPWGALHAQQLWNSPSGTKSDDARNDAGKSSGSSNTVNASRTYLFNSKKYKNQAPVQQNALYNHNRSARGIISKTNRVEESIRAYKNVRMTGQQPSALWSLLSPVAKLNKASDTKLALHNEFKRKQAAAKRMIEVAKQAEINSRQHALERQKKDQRKIAERHAKERAKWNKKMKALGLKKPFPGGVKKNPAITKNGSSADRKLYTSVKSSRSDESEQKEIRLFNSAR